MARKISAKVILNRRALAKMEAGVADGVEEVTRTIVETATPPDATPYGVGLVDAGGWIVYVGGKKVGGGSLGGRQPKKPRSVRVPSSGIIGIAGFGFPGRFQEGGTSHHAAQPFLTPAAERVVPHAPEIMRDAMKRNGF